MHVGYTVQLLLMLNIRMKIESKEPVDESFVRYYSNSLLDVAFPFYDVNQCFSKCATSSTIMVLRLPLVVRRGITKLNKSMLKQYILI